MSLKYKILVSALFRNLNNEIDSSNLRFYRNVISNEIFVFSLDAKWEVKDNVWDKTVEGVIEPISNSKLCIFPTVKKFYSNQFGNYNKYDNISLIDEYLGEEALGLRGGNGEGDSNYNFLYKGDVFQEIPEAFLEVDKGKGQTIKLRDIYKMYKKLNEENIFDDSLRKGAKNS